MTTRKHVAGTGAGGLAAADALSAVARENPGLPAVFAEPSRMTPSPLETSVYEARLERLLQYYALLERWGAALNLSRRRGAEEWARADVADAFLGLAALGARVSEPRDWMDVGSGAGFPGLAVALLWPSCRVRWVESSKKRVSFLQRVARELDLGNVEVLAQRVEDVQEDAEVVSTRATFPWQELSVLREVVRPGGCLVAFVGREPTSDEWEKFVERWGWRGERVPYVVDGMGPRAIAFARRPQE